MSSYCEKKGHELCLNVLSSTDNLYSFVGVFVENLRKLMPICRSVLN